MSENPQQSASLGGPELTVRVYEELRQLALSQMSSERPGHTLQPTALVHEAWVRLSGAKEVHEGSRGLFFRAAAESMRRILIEHARTRQSLKRGGRCERVPMNVNDLIEAQDATVTLAVDDAIERIRLEDEQTANVIKLRFFVGLSVAETAEVLGLSERTVHREWAYARAQLARLLESHQRGA